MPCGKLRHPSSAAWIPALSGGRLRPSCPDHALSPCAGKAPILGAPKLACPIVSFAKKSQKSKLSTFLRVCFCASRTQKQTLYVPANLLLYNSPWPDGLSLPSTISQLSKIEIGKNVKNVKKCYFFDADRCG